MPDPIKIVGFSAMAPPFKWFPILAAHRSPIMRAHKGEPFSKPRGDEAIEANNNECKRVDPVSDANADQSEGWVGGNRGHGKIGPRFRVFETGIAR
jgi:hypothetical protein